MGQGQDCRRRPEDLEHRHRQGALATASEDSLLGAGRGRHPRRDRRLEEEEQRRRSGSGCCGCCCKLSWTSPEAGETQRSAGLCTSQERTECSMPCWSLPENAPLIFYSALLESAGHILLADGLTRLLRSNQRTR